MDTLRLDSLIFALQKNTASLDAVNLDLSFGLGFLLGLLFVGSIYFVWFN